VQSCACRRAPAQSAVAGAVVSRSHAQGQCGAAMAGYAVACGRWRRRRLHSSALAVSWFAHTPSLRAATTALQAESTQMRQTGGLRKIILAAPSLISHGRNRPITRQTAANQRAVDQPRGPLHPHRRPSFSRVELRANQLSHGLRPFTPSLSPSQLPTHYVLYPVVTAPAPSFVDRCS
jgi:hypothetical protein